jgi:hypothetical protein
MPPTTPQTSNPAKSASIENTARKVGLMIVGARLIYPQASANLDHWLNGNGTAVTIPARDFATRTFVIEHLRSAHRPQFVKGARSRLAAGEVVGGRPFVMDYYDSVTDPDHHSDWYYAFGGFQVESQVQVDVTAKDKSSFTLRFLNWNSRMGPYEYHWVSGRQFSIPFIGRVTGDEMLALERAGTAHSFKYSSDWTAITDSKVAAPETIELSTLAR